MSKNEDLLESVILELRQLFDRLSSSYDGIKLKVLALIAGEVAVTPFIFSSERIIPEEPYGIVFFGIGLACFVISFALLLWAISTSRWLIPLDIKESQNLLQRYKNKEDFLLYLKADYEETISYCLKLIGTKARAFNVSLILFSVGMGILFVLKYIQGGN